MRGCGEDVLGDVRESVCEIGEKQRIRMGGGGGVKVFQMM